jgi:ribonuclease P protein component
MRMPLLRLSGRKSCDRIIKLGNVWRGKHMVIRWLPGAPRAAKGTGVFLGIRASTKLDASAVKRNRMRRRCREAFRLALQSLPPGMSSAQLFVSPRSSSLSIDFSELQHEARRFLLSLPR